MLQTTAVRNLLIGTPQHPLTLPHAVALMDDLEHALQKPDVRAFVLDLRDVREVDGSGLGALVRSATMARASGQTFYLYRPSAEVMQALNLLEINNFFPLLEYEEDLLAHMPD